MYITFDRVFVEELIRRMIQKDYTEELIYGTYILNKKMLRATSKHYFIFRM